VPQYAQSKFTQQTSPQFSFGKSQFIAATAAWATAHKLLSILARLAVQLPHVALSPLV
jgi:hypothetical protein